METRTVEVNGLAINWRESGSGPPVVLIHGIPTTPELWRYVIPLVTHARCLALELVGYGDSIPQGRGRDLRVARQADYLLQWLDALEIDRAILVGHDVGGGVAQIAALRRPGIAAGLLLTNSIGYDAWPIPSVKFMRTMGPIVRHLPDAVVKRMLVPLFYRGHQSTKIARESLDLHWRRYERHGGGEPLIRQMKSLDVNDTLAVASDLPKLRGIPARVIWGAADAFLKVKYGEQFARDLGVTLERIEAGRHFTPEDHPAEIARGINELVRESFPRNLSSDR